MKYKLSLVVLFIAVCLQKNVAQYSFPLQFEDDYKDTVQYINNDPEKINKSFTSLGFLVFNMRSYENTYGASNSVSFNLELKHERFVNGTNGMIYGKVGYSALESIKSEVDNEYELAPIFGEVGYKLSLGSQTRTKNRKLNFYNPDRQDWRYSSVIHRAKLPVKYKVQYYLRIGALYDQYSDNREFKFDNNRVELESARGCSFALGLSRQRIGYLHYKSNGFGEQQGIWLTDFYFDLLYSPFIAGYGHYYDENTLALIEESKLNNNLLSTKRLGFRLGGSTKSSLTRINKYGSEIFYEIGFLPGINSTINSTVIGYRLTFIGK